MKEEREQFKKENSGEQFNPPKVVVDLEEAKTLLTDYCNDVRRHEDILKEKNPQAYITGDSRIHFLAWIRNRISHCILRKERELRKKTGEGNKNV